MASRTVAGAAAMLFSCLCVQAAVAQIPRSNAPDSVVYRMLDSLVDVALTSPSRDERSRATIGVLSLGKNWYVSHPERSATPPPEIPYHGLVKRAKTIFNGSHDTILRLFILRWIAYQSERKGAVAFLVRIAQGPPERASEMETMPEQAIKSLMVMGPEGLAALCQLKASGSVRDPSARGWLQNMDRYM